MRLSRSSLMLVVALCLSAFATLAAAQSIDLYEGEVPVSSQAAEVREAALPQALGQALVRLTGDPAIAADPQLAPQLGEAGKLLLQYRYRTVEAGDGGRLLLVASFDPAGVDRLLTAAGRTAWPEPRPQPLVWLAIDDGRGARLVGTAQANAVAALTAEARRRGLQLNYPLLDLEDQQAITADAVWNFRLEPIRAATARYPAQAALVGKLYRDGHGWAAEWRLFDSGSWLEQQRFSDPSATELLARGADLAADALAHRYATRVVHAGPAGRYRIVVAPLASAEDYARLLGYLRGLPIVRSALPRHAEGDRLELELDLTTGIDGFAGFVDGAGVLAPLPAAADDAPRPFRLEP